MALGVEHLHPQGTDRLILVHLIAKTAQAILTHHRVGVEQQHILTPCSPDGLVVGLRKAHILRILDKDHLGEAWFQVGQRIVSGMVIHHKHLRIQIGRSCPHRIEALLQKILHIVIDNDNG